jgi:hypothetical protein
MPMILDLLMAIYLLRVGTGTFQRGSFFYTGIINVKFQLFCDLC